MDSRLMLRRGCPPHRSVDERGGDAGFVELAPKRRVLRLETVELLIELCFVGRQRYAVAALELSLSSSCEVHPVGILDVRVVEIAAQGVEVLVGEMLDVLTVAAQPEALLAVAAA